MKINKFKIKYLNFFNFFKSKLLKLFINLNNYNFVNESILSTFVTRYYVRKYSNIKN